MKITLKLSLVILLATVIARSSDGAEKDHDHDHVPATNQAAVDHHDHAHDAKGDEHEHGHLEEVKLTPEAIQRANIRVEPVRKHPLASTFTTHARVAFNAEAMAHVGSLVAGRIVDIRAGVGDAVNKGDELLVVESMELGQAQTDYLQKRADRALALAAVKPAQQAYQRAKQLHEKNEGIALAEVQKRDAELRTVEANAVSAEAGVAAARNRLLLLGLSEAETKALEETGVLKPKLSIRAPISGRVIEREVTLGELVSPEKERLLVLADMDLVWVLAEVPEARLAQVKAGSPAQVQIAAIPDERFEGKVTQIAPALNPDTRSGQVRIEVKNAERALRPGMFARVTLTSAGQDGTAIIAVPDEAVQTIEGEPSVFVPVEGEPHTFARRAVKVAKPIGAMVPVLSGLKEGEPVVVSGTFILKAELGKSEASHEH